MASKKAKSKAKHKVKATHKPVHKAAPQPKMPIIEKVADDKAFDMAKQARIALVPSIFLKREKDLTGLKKIGFPCVMKVSSRTIIHKTEVNGIRLNVSNEEEALKAFTELMKIKGAEMVVAQQRVSGYELILGGKKDPQFGRVVVIGAGGIMAELIKDVSFRICPLNSAEAESMLKETKFYPMLAGGFRGMKPANLNSIIEAMVAVSKLLEKNPKIKELDINPLFATHEKTLAADIRIILD